MRPGDGRLLLRWDGCCPSVLAQGGVLPSCVLETAFPGVLLGGVPTFQHGGVGAHSRGHGGTRRGDRQHAHHSHGSRTHPHICSTPMPRPLRI